MRAVLEVVWEKLDRGEAVKVIRLLPSDLRDLWPAAALAEATGQEQAKRPRQ